MLPSVVVDVLYILHLSLFHIFQIELHENYLIFSCKNVVLFGISLSNFPFHVDFIFLYNEINTKVSQGPE